MLYCRGSGGVQSDGDMKVSALTYTDPRPKERHKAHAAVRKHHRRDGCFLAHEASLTTRQKQGQAFYSVLTCSRYVHSRKQDQAS